MNILVLMSGPSQAFKDAGHVFPKNLVEIAGQPLVQRVMAALRPLRVRGGRFLCLVSDAENRKYHTGAVIHLLDPDALLILVRGDTAGAACSALLAAEHIDNEDSLVVVNGDQLIEVDLDSIIDGFEGRQLDGGIVVFEGVHPRWSFVKIDSEGFVIEAAEKRPISRLATAGFYYFRHGCDFVKAATGMIKKDAQVDGRFFICPTYNELILGGCRVGVHKIAAASYRSLATPADTAAYEQDLARVLAKQ